MKIAVIGTRGFPDVPGGVESHCQHLYPRLVRMGVEVTVFTRKPYLSRPYRREWQGGGFVNLSCPASKSLEAICHSTLATILARTRRPDILHVHSIGPSMLVPLARATGLRVVMTHHGPDYQRAKWGPMAKLMLKLGERCGCRHANEIIAISSSIRDHIRARFAREAHLICNGVQILDRVREGAHLQRFGVQPERYVLAVARFVPEKGLHHLVRAFSRLQTDWKLVIAGDADHETAYSRGLKAEVANCRNVVLTGYVTGQPLRELYSHAGLFVLPSYYEGLPIALLEALGAGLSAVVSDIPGHREIGLSPDRYFRPGDEDEMEHRLRHWLDLGPLTADLQARQIESIRRHYNWDDVASQVLAIYRSLRRPGGEKVCEPVAHASGSRPLTEAVSPGQADRVSG